jgi:branched-chain amino acid transport system ATP-binding protein
MADPVGLQVERLSAGYGGRMVLHEISLRVGEAQFVALLGANGAGKTTTLRALSGMIAATGSVRLDGRQILGARAHSRVRMGMAHVPEGRGTFPNLSVEENLRVGAVSRGSKWVDQDLADWYETFPLLQARRSLRAGTLSGGEQQMLAIARAMMSRPKILLLDEPSMGLAPNITELVFDRLQSINVSLGTSILVVEQNANIALSTATYAYVMESGQIVREGTAAKMKADEGVRRAYLRV